MSNRFFALEERVALTKPLAPTLEAARTYDLQARLSMRFPMERVVSLLSPHCAEDALAVQVGSTTGLLGLMFGAANPKIKVVGIEENPNYLSVSDENATLATMARTPSRTEFRKGSFARLPFPDNSSDLTFGMLTLHRVQDPIAVIRECARITKPEGFVFLYELARDAEEGMISFILQYVNTGQEQFMESLQASFTADEMVDLLKDAGLNEWLVTRDQLNLRISNRPV
jgi:ubiquinone/menaquinone biosynthesis C-methylase UbiE